MKKILTLALVIILAICTIGLVACGDNSSQTQTPNDVGWGSVFTIETAYAKAQELGYTGSLEDFLETIKGKDGANGKDGKDGINGKDGLGIKSVTIVNGNLIIVFTDDTSVDCGKVVADGAVQTQTHTVTFVTDNEYVTIPSQTIKHGEKVIKPTTPLSGIALDAFTCQGETWSFIGYPVTEDITINVTTTIVGTTGLSYQLDGNSYEITDYTGTDTIVFIPETYNEKPVTSIGFRAFSDCSGLTSITIPNSVTSIGSAAFFGCSGLTSITIPNSVTSIDSGAFSGCTGLASITVESGNTKYHSTGNCIIETESKTLILGCKTSVIPTDGSVTSIGFQAFSGCTGLTSITIPNSVTSIFSDAFYGCTSLVYNKYDNGLYLGNNENSYLWLIKAKDTSISSCATHVNTKFIADNAFSGCTGLTSITISNSVTSIGISAFSGCTDLTSITIPSSVTSIGSSAFSGCTGLASITIPNSITSIDSYTFRGCTGLTSITVESGNAKYHSAGNCLIETTSKTLLLGCKTSVIPTDGSVTSIGFHAFSGCTGLTSITIPNSATNIRQHAFSDCNNLTNVIFENTSGWSANSTLNSSDLENTATAATYLTDTYKHYTWYRSIVNN